MTKIGSGTFQYMVEKAPKTKNAKSATPRGTCVSMSTEYSLNDLVLLASMRRA